MTGFSLSTTLTVSLTHSLAKSNQQYPGFLSDFFVQSLSVVFATKGLLVATQFFFSNQGPLLLLLIGPFIRPVLHLKQTPG
jgi:hypothetical protein